MEEVKSLEEKLSINNLSLNANNKDIYDFEDKNYKNYTEENGGFVDKLHEEIGQRERKLINDKLFNGRKQESKKQKALTGWKAKAGGGYSHQFFDVAALEVLDEKERVWENYLLNKQAATGKKKVAKVPEFTEEDDRKRDNLTFRLDSNVSFILSVESFFYF